MPVTPADIQRIITLRVGDIDPATGDSPAAGGAGIVASNMPTLWMARADKARVAPRLQELYVQRDAIDLVIAVLAQQVDVTIGDPSLSLRLSQRVTVAQEQRKVTEAEIVRLELHAMNSRAPALGQIATKEPVTPADVYNQPWPTYPDPGSPVYSGSPLHRPSWGRS